MKLPILPQVAGAILLSLQLGSGSGHAAPAPLDKAWAEINVDHQCNLDHRTGTECQTEETILILDERARSALGTRTLFFRATGQMEVSDAYTETADGRRIEINGSDFQTGDAPGNSNGFVAVRFIKFAFKEVSVGSTLHLRLRSHTPLVQPFRHVSGIFRQPPSWSRIAKFRTVYKSSQPLYWKGRNLENFRLTASPDRTTLQVESIAPFLIPPTEEGAGFVLREYPSLEISSTETWSEFLAPIAAPFAAHLNSPLPISLQKAVAKLHGQPEAERVRGVLDVVRKRFRLLGDWRESIHGYVPFGLAEIEQRGYGDSRDFALVTTALLRSLGISARIAMIHASADDRPPQLPTLEYLNYALVKAEVDGKTAWLDPTQAVNTLYAAPLSIEQNRIAFVFDPDGKIVEDWIPGKDSEQNYTRQVIDLTPGLGDEWQLSARIVNHGLAAAQNAAADARDGKQDERDVRGLLPGQISILEKKVSGRPESSALIDQQEIAVEARIARLTKPVGEYLLFEGGAAWWHRGCTATTQSGK